MGVALDTSLLVAYANPKDAHHAKAKSAMRRILAGTWGEALLPELVFVETVTVLAARKDQAAASAFGAMLLASEEVEWVPSSLVFEDAWEIFRAQAKATLSFADASIVATARRRSAEYVATFDTDFEGFDRLEVVP